MYLSQLKSSVDTAIQRTMENLFGSTRARGGQLPEIGCRLLSSYLYRIRYA